MLDMGEVLAAELGEAVLAIPGPLRTVLFVRGLARRQWVNSTEWLDPAEQRDGHWTAALLWQAHKALDPARDLHACLQQLQQLLQLPGLRAPAARRLGLRPGARVSGAGTCPHLPVRASGAKTDDLPSRHGVRKYLLLRGSKARKQSGCSANLSRTG